MIEWSANCSPLASFNLCRYFPYQRASTLLSFEVVQEHRLGGGVLQAVEATNCAKGLISHHLILLFSIFFFIRCGMRGTQRTLTTTQRRTGRASKKSRIGNLPCSTTSEEPHSGHWCFLGGKPKKCDSLFIVRHLLFNQYLNIAHCWDVMF